MKRVCAELDYTDRYATESILDLKDQAKNLSEQLSDFVAKAKRAKDKDNYITKYDWEDLKHVQELLEDIRLGVIVTED